MIEVFVWKGHGYIYAQQFMTKSLRWSSPWIAPRVQHLEHYQASRRTEIEACSDLGIQVIRDCMISVNGNLLFLDNLRLA